MPGSRLQPVLQPPGCGWMGTTSGWGSIARAHTAHSSVGSPAAACCAQRSYLSQCPASKCNRAKAVEVCARLQDVLQGCARTRAHAAPSSVDDPAGAYCRLHAS